MANVKTIEEVVSAFVNATDDRVVSNVENEFYTICGTLSWCGYIIASNIDGNFKKRKDFYFARDQFANNINSISSEICRQTDVDGFKKCLELIEHQTKYMSIWAKIEKLYNEAVSE